MRSTDLLALPLAALWQQKSRTVMTTLGVIFGSFVLAASLSIGQGVQDTIERESHRSDFLRKVMVNPKWRTGEAEESGEDVEVPGVMSDERRARIRQAVVQYRAHFGALPPKVILSQEMLGTLAGLPHVEAVVPVVNESCYTVLDDQSQPSILSGARPEDAACRRRLVAGRFFDSATEQGVVVSELLLYRLGLIDEASVEGALGKTLRLEFRNRWYQDPGLGVHLIKGDRSEATLEETAALDKIKQQLPSALDKLDLTTAERETLQKALTGKPARPVEVVTRELPIVGVLRLMTSDERTKGWDPLRVEAEAVVPFPLAAEMFYRVPGHEGEGVHQAVVVVDKEENVKAVHKAITERGLTAVSVLDFVEEQRLIYLLIFSGMTCVAAVALLVAALGIANTMLMSVLERTREIGIMKAVGAGDAQLQFVFLLEGALIGLVGAGLGLALAWAASFPGDAWVRSITSGKLDVVLTESIFVFPAWMMIVVPLFTVAVTTLAAVYPARRVAKIDPVKALRHE